MAETIGKFLGNTVGEAAAFAAGVAIGPVLEPLLQALRNETWSLYPDRPLDAEAVAELVAQGLLPAADGAKEAALTGISKTLFGLLVQATQEAPEVGETIELWRRGLITDKQVDVALAKAKLLPDYREAVKDLYFDRLDPAVIATAIQRGIVADPGFLPVGPPDGEGKVAAFPTSDLDPLAEAKAQGVNRERLFVETAIVGNPASPQQAASGVFRGIIEKIDYYRAIAEGNTRNEWADAIFEQARQILTVHEYVEARLRGWIDTQAMYDGAAQHGMSEADTDLLFKVNGRPIPIHQVTTGLARGGVYDGDFSHVPEAYIRSLEEGNQRPEWYSLSYANRYSLPSVFVMRALTQDGTWSREKAEQRLLESGWIPADATEAAAKWSGGTSTTATTATKRFVTSALTAISKDYVALTMTEAEAREHLDALDVPAADQAALFKVWDVQRAVQLKQLTPAQIATRFKRQKISESVALARLEALGYTVADAAAVLNVAAPVLTVAQIQKGLGSTITYDQAAADLTAEGYTPEQIIELVGPPPSATPPPAV